MLVLGRIRIIYKCVEQKETKIMSCQRRTPLRRISNLQNYNLVWEISGHL